MGKDSWSGTGTHSADNLSQRCRQAVIKGDELRDSDEPEHADDVERTNHAAKKECGNGNDGNQNADRYEQWGGAENEACECWQRTTAKHVGENEAEAADAEAAPNAEVRKTEDDGNKRKTDGVSKLANVNGVLRRVLFGFVHGRCVATPNDLKLSDGGAWRGSCVVERRVDIRTTEEEQTDETDASVK